MAGARTTTVEKQNIYLARVTVDGLCAGLTKSSAQHDMAGAVDAAAVSPPTTHRQVPLEEAPADPLNNCFPCKSSALYFQHVSSINIKYDNKLCSFSGRVLLMWTTNEHALLGFRVAHPFGVDFSWNTNTNTNEVLHARLARLTFFRATFNVCLLLLFLNRRASFG